VVSVGVPLRGPDMLPDDPADMRLGAASEEAVGTAAVPVPLAVGLSVPFGLLNSAYLSCRPLDAACSPVDFASTCVGGPLACVGRGADPAPGIGLGAGRLVAGSIEPPESDESNSLALHLTTVAQGAVCRSAGASSLGTVGRSPEPFALAVATASLLRRSWRMSRRNCLGAVAGNSARWALRKASSSSFFI
jgi:hypothetical protein